MGTLHHPKGSSVCHNTDPRIRRPSVANRATEQLHRLYVKAVNCGDHVAELNLRNRIVRLQGMTAFALPTLTDAQVLALIAVGVVVLFAILMIALSVGRSSR